MWANGICVNVSLISSSFNGGLSFVAELGADLGISWSKFNDPINS